MEILVVVLIVGLLAAIAIPSFRLARRKVQDMLIANNLKQIWNAAQLYFLESGATEVFIEELVWYTEPDGALMEQAENPYTNVIKCIRGEDYGDLFSITQDYVVARGKVRSSGLLYADGMEDLYDQGLILSDTFILATPFEENAEWIGIEVESGNLISTPIVQQALDIAYQELFDWALENDPLNAWQYFDDAIWNELYADFLETKWTFSTHSSFQPGSDYYTAFLGSSDSNGDFPGVLRCLFYQMIGGASSSVSPTAPAGYEEEYEQIDEDLKAAIADIKARMSTSAQKKTNLSLDDFKLAYTLRERIYALGVKAKGINFIKTNIAKSVSKATTNYLNEIYGPEKTALENLLLMPN
jgi:type II secretory pathway pseudopilin PulG